MNTFENISKAYFLGIGGIGMSALARYFKSKGWDVSGYDKTATTLTSELIAEGISVHFDDKVEALPVWLSTSLDFTGCLFVYTPAIPSDNVIMKFLKDQGANILKRSQVLGLVTSETFCIAVAGTHGKTTTSTMIAHLLKHSGRNVTAFLGGISANYNTNLLLAENFGSELMVAEADEYDRSFLKLNPDIEVVTSLDADHLDIYGDHQSMIKSYDEFTGCLKPGGSVFLKYGISLPSATNAKSYASEGKSADAFAYNVRIENGSYLFDFKYEEINISDFRLDTPGLHNVENAVAAISVGCELGLTPEELKMGLKTFKGVKRRFEYILKNDRIIMIDDYAHHPTELKAAITTVKELYPGKKILGIFQPHLYSRTRDFASGFAESLSLLDALILLDIYPARELPIPGVNSSMILEMVSIAEKAVCEKSNLISKIESTDADIVVTLGAGDIDALVQPIAAVLKNKSDLNKQAI